ncbi:MAG: DUF4174 domain-containing protein [Planctomycetota bacterium]
MPTDDAPPTPESLRWKARPLVVFAVNRENPQLARQIAFLKGDLDALQERKIQVIRCMPHGPIYFGVNGDRAEITDPAIAEAWRSLAFDAGNWARFGVSLVGLDGGVKMRSAEAVTIERLSALIDAMPMRQNEMRREQD